MSVLKLPGGLRLNIESPTVDTSDCMGGTIKACMETRAKHLEAYAAAFLKEVGSAKASEYELVEDWSEPLKLKWYFRKRTANPLNSPIA